MAKHKKPQRYPLVEWVSAAIGLVIAGTMFGFLTIDALGHRDGVPPLLEVEPVGLYAGSGRYVLEIEVQNVARRTGAGVQVEGVLKRGEDEVETSTTSISYVPGESRRRAGLVFTEDPRRFQLELRVTGYERP